MARKKQEKREDIKSFIDFIKAYGIDEAKKIDEENVIDYRKTLQELNESGEFKVIDVIDNQATPELSVSCKCQLPSCGKRIRYEFIMQDGSGKQTVVGSSCIKSLTHLADWKLSELLKIPSMLNQEAEHELLFDSWYNAETVVGDGPVKNEKILAKLKNLATTGLDVFTLMEDHVFKYHEVLEPEDLRFIQFSNKEKTFRNVNLLHNVEQILEKAKKYNNDKGLIKRMNNYRNQLRINTTLRDQDVEYIKNYRFNDAPYGRCPECNGKLVLRKGQYGDFVGCENYVLLKCKFTKQLETKKES